MQPLTLANNADTSHYAGLLGKASDLFDILLLLSGHRPHTCSLKPIPPNRLEGSVVAGQRGVLAPGWASAGGAWKGRARIKTHEQRFPWAGQGSVAVWIYYHRRFFRCPGHFVNIGTRHQCWRERMERGIQPGGEKADVLCDLGGGFDCFPSGSGLTYDLRASRTPCGGHTDMSAHRGSPWIWPVSSALNTLNVRQFSFLHCRALSKLPKNDSKGDNAGRHGQQNGVTR